MHPNLEPLRTRCELLKVRLGGTKPLRGFYYRQRALLLAALGSAITEGVGFGGEELYHQLYHGAIVTNPALAEIANGTTFALVTIPIIPFICSAGAIAYREVKGALTNRAERKAELLVQLDGIEDYIDDLDRRPTPPSPSTIKQIEAALDEIKVKVDKIT